MSLSFQEKGPNSYSIKYESAQDIPNVVKYIVDTVTAKDHGWDLVKEVNSTKFILKSKCVNTAINKYISIDIVSDTLSLQCMESFNVDTDTAINPAHIYGVECNQRLNTGVDIQGGVIDIYVHPRWFVAFAYSGKVSGNTQGTWSGVFEFKEDNGFIGTPFCHTDGYSFGGNLPPWDAFDVQDTRCFSVPKNSEGSVEIQDTFNRSSIGNLFNRLTNITRSRMVTNSYSGRLGTSGEDIATQNVLPATSYSVATGYLINVDYDYAYKGGVSATALSKTKRKNLRATVPYACQSQPPIIRGAFFGIKIALAHFGNAGSIHNIKVDDDFFNSPVGTEKPFALIGSYDNRIFIPI